MNTLIRQYEIKLKEVSTKYVRDIYNTIDWNERLIGIKGARGVGKTTLLLQRILLAFPDTSKALYVALDNLWFGNHTLIDLADYAYENGITHLFLDEVHKLRGWEQQIKNIYDIYGNLNIVFTGSSILEIDNSIADLSRRCMDYTMFGLSFREFLAFEGFEFPKISLSDVLYNHVKLSNSISARLEGKVLRLFKKYFKYGYYPFFFSTTENGYLAKVNNTLIAVIENDIPAIENIEYSTLQRCKHTLSILASQTPSTTNLKMLSEMLGTSHTQTLKILYLLNRAQILRFLYYKTDKSSRSLIKPNKILFNNASILYALEDADLGKSRETFMASMLAPEYKMGYPTKGDILVENRYLFEIGGPGKKFTQIKDIPDSFIAADEIECGYGNKIPLWLFGFLY